MQLKAHHLFFLLISIFLIVNILYYFKFEYNGGRPPSFNSDAIVININNLPGKKVSIKNNDSQKNSTKFTQHPPIAILTSNKLNHLDRLLSALLEVKDIDRSRVFVFNEGAQPIGQVLKKHSIPNKLRLNLQTEFGSNTITTNHTAKVERTTRLLKQAMGGMFTAFTTAIFLEDDLIPSYDMIYYFTQLEPLFEKDTSLYCVSGWNDNAYKWASYPVEPYNHQRLLRAQPQAVPPNAFDFHRQSHFGGLGWMTNRNTFNSKILPNWQPNHIPWDVSVQNSMLPHDYCIFPEVPRISHAPIESKKLSDIYEGKPEIDGWSYLQFSHAKIDWNSYNIIDFNYLVNENYDNRIRDLLSKSIKLESLDLLPLFDQSSPVANKSLIFSLAIDDVAFDNDPVWERYMKPFGFTGRGNGGNVRGIYKGMIHLIYHGWPVMLVGRYSKEFYPSVEALPTLNEDDTVAPVLSYDPSIKTIVSKANIFKVTGDRMLVQALGWKGHTCDEACRSKKQSVYCHESDQLLLLDKQATLYLFEKSCDRVEIIDDFNGFEHTPLRFDNYTCLIPSNPSRLSCTYPPPPNTMKLCLCRKMIDHDRYLYHI